MTQLYFRIDYATCSVASTFGNRGDDERRKMTTLEATSSLARTHANTWTHFSFLIWRVELLVLLMMINIWRGFEDDEDDFPDFLMLAELDVNELTFLICKVEGKFRE